MLAHTGSRRRHRRRVLSGPQEPADDGARTFDVTALFADDTLGVKNMT